jgi:hypothetical protein
MIGFQRAWRQGGQNVLVLSGELLNLQVTHLAHTRSQSRFYRHQPIGQGHTHRGQLLGSAVGYGGAGSVLRGQRHSPNGTWVAEWHRELRRENPVFWLGSDAHPDLGIPSDARAEVWHRLGLARTTTGQGGSSLTLGGEVILASRQGFDRNGASLRMYGAVSGWPLPPLVRRRP